MSADAAKAKPERAAPPRGAAKELDVWPPPPPPTRGELQLAKLPPFTLPDPPAPPQLKVAKSRKPKPLPVCVTPWRQDEITPEPAHQWLSC